VAIFQTLNKKMRDNMINVLLILLFCLYISSSLQIVAMIKQISNNSYYFLTNKSNTKNLTDSKISLIINNIRYKSGLIQLEDTKNFIQSERYAQIKSHFRPSELVYEFNVHYFMPDLSLFYGYEPIGCTNILNYILYYDTPEKVVSTLKHLNIRYILLATNTHGKPIMPMPTLFDKKYRGRFLKIVDNGPFINVDITQSNPILLQVLYEESSTDNIEVMKLIDKCNFNQDPKLRTILGKDILNNEIIERMKNYWL
jgi:hypothetical protein